ncbi:hypothetical protein [Paenibacillus alkalitolerans]|uniref:hypothetical protein n=1 Tax=Paenibacillus alkalitolerans TaxID=2799335 RepID=UPI0018F73537|nr:hypothetical protein [Paenibacillus alkalitolerans]
MVNYEEVHNLVGKKVVAIEPALNQFIISFNDGSSLDIQTDDEPMYWEVTEWDKEDEDDA